jgi:hypothetical protein
LTFEIFWCFRGFLKGKTGYDSGKPFGKHKEVIYHFF